MDDAVLIQQSLQGDLDAFNRLVLAYQDMLYNQAYRVIGEPGAAEDATQEAFISAFRKLHTYRGGSFKSWLLRIVTNACYDELRRRKRKPIAPLEPQNEDGEEIESPTWMVDPGDSPEERLQQRELAGAIQRCLDQLSTDFRMVVVLIDVQGLDYAEVSKVLETPLGTIKSRLARARHRMQDCLREFRELLPSAFRLREEAS
ncbi:MAG: sigma-70 family RNA polymerase sigma factor [Anaerolineales bacterium]|nr:sigma-70 family RNA polymerase sigma factor [Chloroflexota bacterium]MBL6981739.1 sigma-70 family RNA polymerase sigma factor [Anaerolineales bacterium]